MPALGPFPMLVIADVLGIPAADADRFVLWSDAAIPDATDLTFEARSALLGEMNAYLLDAAEPPGPPPRRTS